MRASRSAGAVQATVPVEMIEAFWAKSGGLLPAICQNCGRWFSAGIRVSNAREMTFVGNTAGPCPVCGGMGRIPDGTFDFSEVLREAVEESTPDQIQAVEEVLHSVGDDGEGAVVAEQVEVAGGGAWRKVVAYLKPENGSQLAAWANVIINIIRFFTG